MIAENGTGLTNADSYVDPEGAVATAMITARLYSTAWTAATLPEKQAAVMMATRLLDAGMDWNGRPLKQDQALGWPRTGFTVSGYPVRPFPLILQQATVEMAVALLERNRTSDTGSGSQPIKGLSLGEGAIDLQFGEDPTAAAIPAGQMIPAVVLTMLRLLGTAAITGGNGMHRVERR